MSNLKVIPKALQTLRSGVWLNAMGLLSILIYVSPGPWTENAHVEPESVVKSQELVTFPIFILVP